MLFKKIVKFELVACLIFLLTGEAAYASLTIASKDSPNKQKADYVCDGIADQVEIQKAMDSLPSSGGMIELFEGTFNFSDDLEITKSNVTIKGAGRSTILKHDPTKWVKLTKDEKKGSKTITVEDITQFRVGQLIGITNEYIGPTTASPERLKEICGSMSCPYYVTYYSPSEIHVIRKISGNTITIRGLENEMLLSENPRVAPAWVMIKAYNKTNLELRDFSINCNRDNVARIYHGYCHYPDHPTEQYKSPPPSILGKIHHGEEPTSAIYMDYAHNSEFRNLYLHDIPMSGIFLIDSDYVLIEGNTIRDYGLKGYVNCFGDNTRIIGNVIENSLYEDGINVYDRPSSYAIVSNNIVRNCPRSPICINQARRAVVTGNIVDGGGTGIFVCTQEATITGNYCENTVTGIAVYTLPDFWKIQRNDYAITLMGNSIRGCKTGFDISNVCNITLTGNSVAQTKEFAVTSNENVIGLIISNNQFLNSSLDKSVAIKVAGDNHFIFGNKIMNFNKGIFLDSTAEKNIIERNEFIGVTEKIIDKGTGNIKERNL